VTKVVLAAVLFLGGPLASADLAEWSGLTPKREDHIRLREVLEANLSTWVPEEIGVPARGQSQSFARGRLPKLEVNYLSASNPGGVRVLAGASYYQTTRQGSVQFSGMSEAGEQTARVISLAAGLAVEPTWLRFWRLSTDLRLALLPSLLSVEESIFSDEEESFGLGSEAYLGTRLHLGRL